MYDPTSLNLPAFASVPDLLDTVIADCRALFKDPNYLPAANEWHTQILDEYENPLTCAVCVAGSFLVRQLKPPKDQTLFPSDYPPRVTHLLYSINGLRQGLVKDELITLLHLLPEKKRSQGTKRPVRNHTSQTETQTQGSPHPLFRTTQQNQPVHHPHRVRQAPPGSRQPQCLATPECPASRF